MIWLLRNIILALHSEKNRWQLALGAVMGWHLGMIPWDNAIWASLLLLTLCLRANLGLVVVFLLLSKSILLQLDTSALGLKILEHDSLIPFWTEAFNTPFLAISGFNRVDIMGGLACAMAISILTFPLLLQITKIYQRYILTFIEKFWIVKLLKGSRFFQWYLKVLG
jgi:uncharacterized protein (TIGR03546 family)